MKRSFILASFLCFILSATHAQTWRLITPTYATSETVVAGFSVADFGATGDGVTDVTSIFQARLTALGALGGGTLWVPAGKYVISGNLLIPRGVVLRGDWRQPVKGQPIVGTILMAYAGRGDTSATPFITQQPESAVQDVAIWYPQQLPNNIVPYPPSILFGDPGFFGNDFCNANNITLVNSYLGVCFSLLNGGTCPVMTGIFGTPLSTGCMIDNIVDVGRIENIDFSPAYWEGSGLPNAPAVGSYVETWIKQHGIGILMRRDDWTYTSYVSVDGYNIGFNANLSIASPGAIPNGHCYSMLFKNCNYGVYFNGVSGLGIMFARVNMVNCTNGIFINATTSNSGGAAQFHTCTIDASNDAVYTDSACAARLMLEHCTITRGKVDIGGGTFMPSDCDFNNIAPQITLESNSRGIITGNRFKTTASITNNSPYQCAIDNTAMTLKAMPSFPTIVTETHMPTRLVFYNAAAAPYNAKNDNSTDNTTAIQNALNQASTDGGGIVFLPPGKYRINGQLTIPSNVELKGASDIGVAPGGQGSVLETTYGAGTTTGAFITINANGGLRGVTIDYPTQLWTGSAPTTSYPYAIRGNGSNIYVINIAIRDCYQGIDLFTNRCDNHYIDFIVGQIFVNGFRVGGGSVGGKMYNLHFNTQFYANGSESKYGSWPNSPSIDGDGNSYAYNYANFVWITLGNCSNETLYNDFEFGAIQGLTTIADGASGPTGTSVGLGIDGTRNSMNFQAAGAAGFDLINTQDVSLTDAGNTYVATTAGLTHQVNLYNSDYWGNPPNGIIMTGGTLNLEQANFNQPAQTDFAQLTGSSSLLVQSSAIWPVNNLLASGNESHLSARSSIVDSSNITRANTALWKNNLGNAWNYIGGGAAANIPGKILLINYNSGGEGVGYHDADAINHGGQYRPSEGVDIENSSEGTYDIGFTAAGEWMKYNVNVAQSGTYTLQVRVATPNTGGTLRVLINGVNITPGDITVPNTGGYQTWQNVTVTTAALTAGGVYVMEVFEVTGGYNLQYVNFIFGTPPSAPSITSSTTGSGNVGSVFTYNITASNTPTSYSATGLPAGLSINDTTGVISGIAQSSGTTGVTINATNATGTGSATLSLTFGVSTTESAYGGIVQTIPGQILAYDFDNGGQNVAYNDNDATNNGNKLRLSEGVDIESSSEGMYDIGWTNSNEWMKYTVNVVATGTYIMQARVASPGAGQSFRVESDGTTIGTISVPTTGGTQTWATASTNVTFNTTGQHTLRIFLITGGFNLEYLNFLSTPGITSATTANGTLGNVFAYTITGSSNPTSYHASGLPAGLSIDTSTGIISGTPLVIGSYPVNISATNALGTGSQTLTLSITASTSESAFSGVTAYIPGQIFLYNYDNGGEGVAYHDNDATNNGGAYRISEGVDVENSGESIYDVGFTNGGEYMNYAVNVTSAGTYTLQARVASQPGGGAFHVEINGANVTGTINVDTTGGWQTYKTLTITTSPILTTGVQTMKFVEEAGNFNIEWLNFSFSSPQSCLDGATTFDVTPAIGNTYQWQVNSGSGFTNLVDDSEYTGTTTAELVLFTASSSKYGYQYRCAVTNGSTTFSTADTLGRGDTWTGATSTAWEDPTNWSCGNVPDANTDVIFNASSSTAVISSNVTIRTLRVYPGVHITLNSNDHLTILK